MGGDTERIKRPPNMVDLASMFISIFGIFLIAVLLVFLVRIQRGLLGIILAGVAVVLILYWMKELRKIVKGEFKTFQSSKKKWNYDIFEGDELITVVAEVPGPADEVKVKINRSSLIIFGGSKFKKRISIPKGISLIDKSYVNGIINIRLSKKSGTNNDNTQGDSLSSSEE